MVCSFIPFIQLMYLWSIFNVMSWNSIVTEKEMYLNRCQKCVGFLCQSFKVLSGQNGLQKFIIVIVMVIDGSVIVID